MMTPVPGAVRRWVDTWRPREVTRGLPAFPLFVLFGLNAADELDRSAFAVLLPDIRDDFGLSDAGALALVSVSTITVLLIGVPLPFYCDRANRVRIATVGAAVWGLFGTADPVFLVILAYAPTLPVAIAMHALLAGTIGTLAPAFFALLSLVAPPRVRAAAFSTIAVFALPGIAVFLPLIGFVSDEYGIQPSMFVLVPVALAAGFILSTAAKFVLPDIAASHAESVARVQTKPS